MYIKDILRKTINTCIVAFLISFLCFSNVTEAVSGTAHKIIPTQFNIMPDKVWTIKFNKEIDLNSVNSENVRVYDKVTGQTIYINIIKDKKNNKSFQVKPVGSYTKGKGYSIEIRNIKTLDKTITLNSTKMDFYIKNIYSGLPGENGLVIVKDKAYAVDYFKSHSKEVNDIVLSKDYDIYYTYDINYEKINSIFKTGNLNGSNTPRRYDEITYVDSASKKHLYRWDQKREEYIFIQPSLDVDIVVRSDIKLVTIKTSNLIAVPDGKYFKIKHSNLIYKIGDTVSYTASENWEEISILTQDKAVIATGYLNVGAINKTKCYLKTIDDYGLGNFSGNINNNGIAAQDKDGFIYYVNTTDKEKLYKIGLDGMYNKKITEDKVQYLNISQDYIYYSNYADGGKLYKSKTDGSKSQKICDDKAAYITLSGEYIYYSNHSRGGKLYKIKKDGSGTITDKDGTKHGTPFSISYGDALGVIDEVAYISIVGDWIYYSNYSDGHKPYVINKEGTYRGKLSDEWATNIQVYGDWIYYSSGKGIISKIRKDGSGSIIPIKAQTAEYNKGYYYLAFEDWIYYSNQEDQNKLYKVKTDGSGEKVKLCDDSVGYINLIGRDLYYNTLKGKVNKVSIDTDGKAIPQELGKIIPNDQVNNVDNLQTTVDYEDVNQPLTWIENKYLPEKVAGIMVNNTMQQLVVIWDRDPKRVVVKEGVFTYKGNLLGYNKTITMALTIPSEMLNDTNEIYVYNNGEKNDTVEITGTKDGLGVKIQDGDIIKVYSEEACINNLGKGVVGRDRKAVLTKLDLDPYGKSIWVTVMRKGKAQSKPTEVKQTEASIIRTDAALDDDKIGIGVDGRDLRITSWIPSKINNPVKQYIYLVPSKTILDMRLFKAVDSNLNISSTSWSGSKYNKDTAFKRDSKDTVLKAGKYDVYIAADYQGTGTPDVDGNSPSVYGKVSCDTPAIVSFDEEKLPVRPTIKKQIVQGNGEVLLDKAPAEGESAWLIPVKQLNLVKGWKAEDFIKNPFEQFKTFIPDGIEFKGDGSTKEIVAPKGLNKNDANYENVEYKLFIVNTVGASVESANVIIVDNKKPILTVSSNTSVISGDKIDVKSDENGRVYILKSSDNSSTVEQLENAVKVSKTGKLLSVTAGTTYKLDIAGLEAATDNPLAMNYKIVVVDEAGNISTEQVVSIYVRTSELAALISFADTTGMDTLNAEVPIDDKKVAMLSTAITTAEKTLDKALSTKIILQSEITGAFNNLKNVLKKLNVPVPDSMVLDVMPPVFAGTYPRLDTSSISQSQVKVLVKMDEECTVYYVALPKNSLEPSSTQIYYGQDATDISVVTSGSVKIEKVDVAKPIEFDVKNLAANTEYKIYLIAEDTLNNISKVKVISVKTLP